VSHLFKDAYDAIKVEGLLLQSRWSPCYGDLHTGTYSL